MSDRSDDWDWRELFAVLGLDLAAPFLTDIGLAVDRLELIRSIAESIWRAGRDWTHYPTQDARRLTRCC